MAGDVLYLRSQSITVKVCPLHNMNSLLNLLIICSYILVTRFDVVLRIEQHGAAGASTQLVELTRNVDKMIKRHREGKKSSRQFK